MLSVIHAFDYHVDGAGPAGRLLARKGQLLGTTRAGGPTVAGDGVVFSVDLISGVLTNLYSFAGGGDGLNTMAGVVEGPNGRVYGVTSQGGGSGAGTIYSVRPTSHAHVVLHDFSIGDGSEPSGEMLLQASTKFYGVTVGGGSGHGVIYELVP